MFAPHAAVSWCTEMIRSHGTARTARRGLRRRMKRYRNNFERLFRFYAPWGFYADMARSLDIHYVLLHKYINGHAPESTQRANDICTYLTGRTSYNVQPETLWPDKFGIVIEPKKYCLNEAFAKPDILDKIENEYGKDSTVAIIIEEYIRGSTYEQIGQKVGRTRERVRQIINRVAREMKKEKGDYE